MQAGENQHGPDNDGARLGQCERTEETAIGREIVNVLKEAADTTPLPQNEEEKQDDATLSPKRKKLRFERSGTCRMKEPAVLLGGHISNSGKHTSSQEHASTSQRTRNERITYSHSQHQWHYSTDKSRDVGRIHPDARF